MRHLSRDPAREPSTRIGTSLVQFHQGLIGPHGNLTCASCHHPDDGYQSLRLADGSNSRMRT
ncbi:MAG: hypothetical protein U1D30_25620 [Planctomycetota bacterium]